MKKTQKELSLFLMSTLVLIAVSVVSCASNKENQERSPEQNKAEIYYSQGTNDLIKKNYSQALINLLKAKEYDPNNSQIRNNLGMAYYFREQPVLAEEELKKSIELDKTNSDARLNLGTLYLEKNRLKEARAQYEIVVKDLTFRGQFRNLYNLAMVSLKEGDRKEAYEYLFKSIKEREDYCQAHFKLGELYMEEYKFKPALDSFVEATKGTCVSEPAPHYQQGVALMNLNRLEEARMKFKNIIEKFPKTNYNSLAHEQLRKITAEVRDQSQRRTYQTEVIRENNTIETPNF